MALAVETLWADGKALTVEMLGAEGEAFRSGIRAPCVETGSWSTLQGQGQPLLLSNLCFF